MYRVLDLFCGCGGMSWGLEKSGFEIVGGIDIWDIALATFQKNHKHAQALNRDIAHVEPGFVIKQLGIAEGDIDVIIGGPPCQGFSKNTPASWRFLEDPKNQMYHSYIDFVRTLMPSVVIIENVAEIYNAYDGIVRNEIIEALESLGYKVEVRTINMSDYGVPQKRRRCFFFGSLKAKPSFPAISPRKVSAWEAISDLPIVEQGEGFDGMPYTLTPSNKYQEHMRLNSSSVNNHIARVMRPLQSKRIASIGPGQSLRDMPKELQVKGGYSGAYGRLDYEMIAPTITRWVFHIGSGRFAHPRETRGLTMREAARIQSFSDDFYFCGSINEQAGQIGNAVPPLFMEKLGAHIKMAVEGVEIAPRQLEISVA